MILKSLSLLNFKNHQNLQIQFEDKVNCFLGDNGVGKTNLLDAIHYLSFCKSYYSSDPKNISYGDSFFMLQGSFLNEEGLDVKVDCSFSNNKKQVKFNDKKYDKLSSHIGKLPLVIITPLDSGIILGASEERRRFFDKLLSQLDGRYIYELIAYNKTLQQRNALLKKTNSINTNLDLLMTYDQTLSEYGDVIFEKRKKCVDIIIKSVQKYYDFIADGDEHIDVIYKSQLEDQEFLTLLNSNREKDKILTFTSSGIHRDDFIFKLNKYSLKKSGSQGQQKSFLIALKFAYFDLLKSILKVKPIFLLDDIFDKLDGNRVEKIIQLLNKNDFGQIFITDTSLSRIDSIMSKIDSRYKYFLFDKTGLYNEKLKN